MDLTFEKIDMGTWQRAQSFYYYTEIVTPISYTVNIDINVTRIRKTAKNRNLKFFPAYLYAVSRAILNQREFRLAVKDGELGSWNYLTPQYPVFHENNKTFSFLWTEYVEDFNRFHESYMEDARLYGNRADLILPKGSPPGNCYIISCVPWFSFNGLSFHMQNVEGYYLPVFVSGAFREENGDTFMPLSITINHAAADGYHIHVFMNDLQRLMNQPEQWLIPCQ